MLNTQQNLEIKKGLYFKCKICSDEIYHNTNGWPLSCGCGAVAIQGDGEYVEGQGNPINMEIVEKYGPKGEQTRKVEMEIS